MQNSVILSASRLNAIPLKERANRIASVGKHQAPSGHKLPFCSDKYHMLRLALENEVTLFNPEKNAL